MAVRDFSVDAGAVPGLPGAVLVVVRGPIDSRTAERFREEVDGLTQRRFKWFILDMSEVPTVNSTGLAYLVTLSGTVGDKEGCLLLCGLQEKVLLVFQTMGLMTIAAVHASREEAVKDAKTRADATPRPTKPASAPPPARPGTNTLRRVFRKIFGAPEDR